MAANATFALNAGEWFRRARLLMISPDSSGTACPLSGRNSTYRPVQISEASSSIVCLPRRCVAIAYPVALLVTGCAGPYQTYVTEDRINSSSAQEFADKLKGQS